MKTIRHAAFALLAAVLAVMLVAASNIANLAAQSLLPQTVPTALLGCVVRAFMTPTATSDLLTATLACNSRGDHLVAQSLPERSELVRMGYSWGFAIPTGSAAAPVAAWPTTTCAAELFNGEQAGGKSYLIDRIWVDSLTSQTAAQPFGILAQVVPNSPSFAAPTDNAAILRYSMSGNRTNYNGKAAIALATTVAIANKWFPLGTPFNTVATTNLVASYLEKEVYGRYVVPPGAALCTSYVASAATGTMIGGVEWHEVQLANGF